MLFFQKSMDFPVVFLLAIFLSHHGRINWSNSPRIIIRKNHVKHSAQAISFFAFKFIASDNHLIYIYNVYIYIDIQIPMKDGDFLVYLWKMVIPSGKHTKSYWKWQFIVSFPIKTCDFHSYVSLPEGIPWISHENPIFGSLNPIPKKIHWNLADQSIACDVL